MKMPKRPADPRGGHVRLYWELMDSPAWNCLTASDQRVYITLARQLLRTNNGDVCLPISKAKHYQIRSATTLAKSLRALVAVGLISVTRRGGSTRDGRREPTLYCFTSIEVYEMPKKFIQARQATDDWKKIKNLAHGKAVIKIAENEAGERAATKKAALQNLIATTPKIDSKTPKTPPKNEVWQSGPLQKLESGKQPKKAAKPITALVSELSAVSVEKISTLQKVESLCIDAIHRVPAVVSAAVAASGSKAPRTPRRPTRANATAL
jgi:hypothetical protein